MSMSFAVIRQFLSARYHRLSRTLFRLSPGKMRRVNSMAHSTSSRAPVYRQDILYIVLYYRHSLFYLSHQLHFVFQLSLQYLVFPFVSMLSILIYLSQRFSVVNQYYEAEVVSEYVIKGNTAVLKCTIPSFVADFLRVEAWVASDNTEYLPQDDFGRS